MYNQEVIFTKEDCNRIIDMNDGFTQSKLYYADGGNIKFTMNKRSSYQSSTKTTDEIRNLLLPKLSKHRVISLPNNFNILRYEKGQEFKKHRDVGLNEYTNKRYKTLIIQLSNFDDYEGGDLIVWDNDGVTETICNKDIGNMILLPSKLLHQAKPVTSGTRYVMTFSLTNEHFDIKNTLI